MVRNNNKKIFKVEAEGDTLYIQAATKKDAQRQLFDKIGNIPEPLLSWSEVKSLPRGEEFL